MDAIGHIDNVRAAVPPGLFSVPGSVRRGDPLIIRGWALQAPDRQPFDSIEALIGTGLAVDAIVGVERPDVVAALSLEPAVNAGFVIVAETDELTAGPQEVIVRGRRAGDEPQRIGSFAIDVRGPRRVLDAIPGAVSTRVVVDRVEIDHSAVIPVVQIDGWALDEVTWQPGSRVVVTIGALAVEAVYGYPRPDVVATFGLDPTANGCGFRTRVALDELDDARDVFAHLDTIDGVRRSSTAALLPPSAAPLANDTIPRARGCIETLHVLDPAAGIRDATRALRAKRGDQVVVTGWAASDYDALTELVAIVDGTHRIPIHTRLERHDVAAAYPDAAVSGFVVGVEVDVLAPGFHEVAIHVLGSDRAFHSTSARATIEVV
jgi:hypothetical protein